MPSPYGRLHVIANPRAGRGRDAVLARLVAALEERGLQHTVATTSRAADATQLARRAVVDHGARFVVAVGGDGTVHEVVNGLVDAHTGLARADDLVLGIVPSGSGGDFARTFGLDRPPERLVRHLDGDTVYPIDIGRVRLTGPDGRPAVRLFVNVAEAGYGGIVVDRARRLPRLLGRTRYLVAVLTAVRSFGTVESRVVVDHTTVEEPLSNVVVANGQFFGGGMKVAPRALPDDGRFNVQLWRGAPRDVFLATPKIRLGEHLGSPDVREYQSAGVHVDAAAPLVVEGDGEVLGTTPASFDLLPRCLRLKV